MEGESDGIRADTELTLAGMVLDLCCSMHEPYLHGIPKETLMS